MAKRRAQKRTEAEIDRRRAELTAVIERDFDGLDAEVVRTLAAVAAAPPPPAARELMFEVFEAGPGLDAAYRILGANGFAEQIGYGKLFENEALASVAALGPADVAIEVEWRLVREALSRRFPAWWAAAGGAAYPLPVRLAEHDSLGETHLAWAGTAGQPTDAEPDAAADGGRR